MLPLQGANKKVNSSLKPPKVPKHLITSKKYWIPKMLQDMSFEQTLASIGTNASYLQ